uniref:Transmembrane protein 267 n=1 Tax=Ciona savignyi TaxID=51511 RepID=H2YJ56_CIOSA
MKYISLKLFIKLALLDLFCVLIDIVYSTRSAGLSVWGRAIADSSVHFLVAVACWAVVVNGSAQSLILESLICGLLSSLVDVDHFIEARQLSLSAAISVNHRGALHCFATIPVVAGLIWVVRESLCDVARYLTSSILIQSTIMNLHIIISVAWLSHQLRDATRRGIYIMPMCNTNPIPQYLYIAAVTVFSYLLNIFWVPYNPGDNR